MNTHRVIVIGAGYAGTMAANRLLGSLSAAELDRTTVTVVNPRPDFVERIRLHELVAGSRDSVSVPLTEVLHPAAELVCGTATEIDATAREIVVDGRRLGYDRLVYSPGSRAASLPGANEHAFLLADPDDAARAAEALRACGPQPRIVVVGGGPTGIEAAAELAEARPDAAVTVISAGPILSAMRSGARRSITRTLGRLGVRIEQDSVVTRIAAGTVLLADGRELGFDLCLAAASFSVPELARTSGLPVDRLGRLLVDETLRVPGRPEIVGAGDAVRLPDRIGAHLRMGCATALPLGGFAAEVVLAGVRDTAPPVASVGYLVQCVSLGRRRGYIQPVRPSDRPLPLHLAGRAGAWAKETVCRMTLTAPQGERAKPGSYWAPRGPVSTRPGRSGPR